jgi:hypothetical protein
LQYKKEYNATHKKERQLWLEQNKESQLLYNKKYQAGHRQKNKEKLAKYFRERFQEKKEEINRKARERRKNSPQARTANNLRSRIGKALQGVVKSARTMELLGCPIDDFVKYIASQFDNKMSWVNYGEWHIDHIIPCALFDLENADEQKMCFHHKNLRPLWGKENIVKSNKINKSILEEHKWRLTDQVYERLLSCV